jgi:hypothetical protein
LLYYFIYLLLLLVSNHRCLDTADFNSLQNLEAKAFEQQAGEEGVLDHVEPMMFPPLVYTITRMH